MSFQQIDAGEIGGLLRIIGSIATIIALYTGMTWYVFHIYFGQVMSKLTVVETEIHASAQWKIEHSKQEGITQERVAELDKRVGVLEVVSRKNGIAR